jgi:hypothetical protein
VADANAGILTAWSWGFHRVIDALGLAVVEADLGRVGVAGCRKAGKAALAAGLFDKRIGLTVPINSGVMGISPYRYSNLSRGAYDDFEKFTSTVAPWFTSSKLGQFVKHPENLPFDAHTIAAAIAPRTLLINEGCEDPGYPSRGAMTVSYPAIKAVYDFLGAGDQFLTTPKIGGFSCNSGTLYVFMSIFFLYPKAYQCVVFPYSRISATCGIIRLRAQLRKQTKLGSATRTRLSGPHCRWHSHGPRPFLRRLEACETGILGSSKLAPVFRSPHPIQRLL